MVALLPDTLIPVGTIGTTSTDEFQTVATQPIGETVGDAGGAVARGTGSAVGSIIGGLIRGLLSDPFAAGALVLVAAFAFGQLFDVQIPLPDADGGASA